MFLEEFFGCRVGFLTLILFFIIILLLIKIQSMLVQVEKSELDKVQHLQSVLNEYDTTVEDLLDFFILSKTKREKRFSINSKRVFKEKNNVDVDMDLVKASESSLGFWDNEEDKVWDSF